MEANKKKCKRCNEMKLCIQIGRYNYKTKRYVDITGKAWNGAECPSCHVDRSKDVMAKMRFKRKQKEAEEPPKE